ncbi:MAG: hypothetical protein ACM3SX_06830 [Deltaproteobacteria bacterium]
MWPSFDTLRIGPLGWLGVMVAAAGGAMIGTAATRAEWTLVAVGAILLAAGGWLVTWARRRSVD